MDDICDLLSMSNQLCHNSKLRLSGKWTRLKLDNRQRGQGRSTRMAKRNGCLCASRQATKVPGAELPGRSRREMLLLLYLLWV